MTARLSIFGLPGPKLPKPSRFFPKRIFVAPTREFEQDLEKLLRHGMHNLRMSHVSALLPLLFAFFAGNNMHWGNSIIKPLPVMLISVNIKT